MFGEITIWQDVRKRVFRNSSSLVGGLILFLLLFMAIIGPWLTPYDYFDINLELKNSPPSKKFWFGTDELGRDIFTRTWWGARISLFVGICAAFIDVFIGVIWGTIAAISSPRKDEFLMRICDILYAIPNLLAVIMLLVVLGPGIVTIIIALTITGWINMARIVRGQMLQLKEMDFVMAAKSMGASKSRIIFYHLLPNCMGIIIATMTLTIPSAIFAEAFLSFLGLGIQAPFASWGVMVNDGLTAMRYYPWRLFFPSIMIILTILGFNLFGDGLQDTLDPRLKK
jgi:oligopeptide transport system permease protein